MLCAYSCLQSIFLSKSEFTSWSCSTDFPRNLSSSGLIEIIPTQKSVLRSSSLCSRRLRVSKNNSMFPLRSSIPTNGWSAWSWVFAASCCPSSSKLLSAGIPEILDDSNRSLFFGLPCSLVFSWVSSSLPSVSM